MLGVQRNQLAPAATFDPVGAVPVISQKAFQSRQQEGTKSSLLGFDFLEKVIFEQPKKEFLSQILSLFRVVARAPDECINRVPIRLTHLPEGDDGAAGGIDAACLQNHAPMS